MDNRRRSQSAPDERDPRNCKSYENTNCQMDDNPDQTNEKGMEDNQAKAPFKEQLSEPGIICSNSDLSSLILANREGKEYQLGGRRKSSTLVKKGLLLRGLLSQEMAQKTRAELCEIGGRRISTGSFENAVAITCMNSSPKSHNQHRETSAHHHHRQSSLCHQESNNRKPMSLLRRLSKVERQFSMDDDKIKSSRAEFAINPLVIGSVIESYLKTQEESPAAATSGTRQKRAQSAAAIRPLTNSTENERITSTRNSVSSNRRLSTKAMSLPGRHNSNEDDSRNLSTKLNELKL